MKMEGRVWRKAAGAAIFAALALKAEGSVAYGTLNNFDTVNDTGVECHGFEIEIEDVHSTDITYTYDWNHYGTPRISEDNSDPLHSRVRIRYESRRNADGSWAAYTAIPAGPIAPTDGHQFTNPNVNFGGEHFGAGYRGAAGNIRYHWLVDDGFGNLVLGPAVNVSTPVYTYAPPEPGVGAVVQAAIRPAPAEPRLEFGPASWVKVIRTTSHNTREIPLRELVSEDHDDPDDLNWRNGEPDEVEVEWRLLQTEFSQPDGGRNGLLDGAPQELNDPDEVVTTRYEFYKYVGPVDPETGEADTDNVGEDGIHGVGDYATVVVVGDYIGSQMSAFDADVAIGLADHVPEGRAGEAYATRTVVIASAEFDAILEGALPEGMTFDAARGELGGEPTEEGIFTFTVRASALGTAERRKTYTLAIAPAGGELPPHTIVSATPMPLEGGQIRGGGFVLSEQEAAVIAEPAEGFAFEKWMENGQEVSRSIVYKFRSSVNRDLTAMFAPMPRLSFVWTPGGALKLLWPAEFGTVVLETATDPAAAQWMVAEELPETVGDQKVVTVGVSGTRYFRLKRP